MSEFKMKTEELTLNVGYGADEQTGQIIECTNFQLSSNNKNGKIRYEMIGAPKQLTINSRTGVITWKWQYRLQIWFRNIIKRKGAG